MRYAVVIEKAGSGYSGYVPDLPGCVAAGGERGIGPGRIGRSDPVPSRRVAGGRRGGAFSGKFGGMGGGVGRGSPRRLARRDEPRPTAH